MSRGLPPEWPEFLGPCGTWTGERPCAVPELARTIVRVPLGTAAVAQGERGKRDGVRPMDRVGVCAWCRAREHWPGRALEERRMSFGDAACQSSVMHWGHRSVRIAYQCAEMQCQGVLGMGGALSGTPPSAHFPSPPSLVVHGGSGAN